MLLFASTDTKWFAEASEHANQIALLTKRISFLDHQGLKQAPAPKGSCLIDFSPQMRREEGCHIEVASLGDIANKKKFLHY